MDVFTREKRSAIMRRVKSVDTAPELRVRGLAHRLGYRFRIHRKDLPGCPDLVFVRRRVVVFVHGCFWHGHGCHRGRRIPRTNQEYWRAKLKRNRARDRSSVRALQKLGWRVEIIWECQTRDEATLANRLIDALGSRT